MIAEIRPERKQSQEKELLRIFGRLKKILKKFEDPLEPKFDIEGKYDLWSFKDVIIAGRQKKLDIMHEAKGEIMFLIST